VIAAPRKKGISYQKNALLAPAAIEEILLLPLPAECCRLILSWKRSGEAVARPMGD